MRNPSRGSRSPWLSSLFERDRDKIGSLPGNVKEKTAEPRKSAGFGQFYGTFSTIVLLGNTPGYFKRGVFVAACQLQRVLVGLIPDDARRSAIDPAPGQRDRCGIPRSNRKLDFERFRHLQVRRIPAPRGLKRVDVQRFRERQHEFIIPIEVDRDHRGKRRRWIKHQRRRRCERERLSAHPL